MISVAEDTSSTHVNNLHTHTNSYMVDELFTFSSSAHRKSVWLQFCEGERFRWIYGSEDEEKAHNYILFKLLLDIETNGHVSEFLHSNAHIEKKSLKRTGAIHPSDFCHLHPRRNISDSISSTTLVLYK